jgi:hypothetical protein
MNKKINICDWCGMESETPNKLTIKNGTKVVTKKDICNPCAIAEHNRIMESHKKVIIKPDTTSVITEPLRVINEEGKEEEFGVKFSPEKVFAAMDSNRSAAEKRGQAFDNIGKGVTANNSDCKHYARSFGDGGTSCKDCGKSI